MKNTSPPEVVTGNQQLTATPRYGSKKDVAAMVQMSVRSVDNWIRIGLPHLRVSRRKLRFDMDEVRQWLADTFRTQRRASR